MLPATVGFLLLVAVVFFFGLKSARNSARYHEEKDTSATGAVGKSPAKEKNPAMSMAGPTGANEPQSDARNSLTMP
jgi:hypothetical protein